MRTKTMMPALLLAAVAVTVGARPAAGQVRLFELPDTVVNLSTYRTVEECDAAVARVQALDKIRQSQTTHIFPDTMPFDRDKMQRPLPPAIVETAGRCLDAISAHVDTADIATWEMLVPLYLAAGRDESARALVERRIENVEPDSTDELHRVLMQTAELLGKGHPPRHELAEEIVSNHVGKLPKLMDRINVYGGLLGIAFGQAGGNLREDSEAGARARRILAMAKALLDSASPDELQRMAEEGSDLTSTPEEIVQQLEARSMLLVGQVFRRDSLRVSTEAYAKALREVYEKGFGMKPAALLGQRAPRMEGDVWLGCEQDPCEPYPRPGRVTLVWFFDGCFDYMTRVHHLSAFVCAERWPMRRIHDRFPEVDIVVVMKSTGRFAYVKDGMTPEREAQFVRKWLDQFGLNRAVLTMTETQGWRLPEPDGRWAVRHETANEKNYWPGEMRQGVMLIDQDGYAVHAGTLNFNHDLHKLINEQEFVSLIEILLEREKAKSQ